MPFRMTSDDARHSRFVLLGGLSGLAAVADEGPFGLENRIPWDASRLSGSPEPPLPYTVEKTYSRHTWKIAHLHRRGARHRPALGGAGRQGGRQGLAGRPDSRRPRLGRVRGAPGPPQAAHLLRLLPPGVCRQRLRLRLQQRPARRAGRRNRISRYYRRPEPPRRIDPASEEVVIEWKSAGHDGGDMAFGRDGFLYITTGDGTSDSDAWNSGQTLDDLLGSVLRIDVDRRDGERRYGIPADNPFVDRPGARPGDLGLRAPQPLADRGRPGDRPDLGGQQRAGPLGDRPPDPPRRELRLERLRGEPPLLPGTQARAHARSCRRRSSTPTPSSAR